MGQLFWKFLGAFWLALGCAFGLIWGLEQFSQREHASPRLMYGPQARLIQQTAQTMVDAAGVELLGHVLSQWDRDPFAREQILILDAVGQDFLKRPVPTDWRQLLAQRTQHSDFRLRDQHGRYWQLLAIARPQHWPGHLEYPHLFAIGLRVRPLPRPVEIREGPRRNQATGRPDRSIEIAARKYIAEMSGGHRIIDPRQGDRLQPRRQSPPCRPPTGPQPARADQQPRIHHLPHHRLSQ